MLNSVPKSRNIPSFLEPFQRITTSGGFIPEIDGLRFAAIFFVVIYHQIGTVLFLSPSGQQAALRDSLSAIPLTLPFGVQMFFAISGFILGMPFALQFIKNSRSVSL